MVVFKAGGENISFDCFKILDLYFQSIYTSGIRVSICVLVPGSTNASGGPFTTASDYQMRFSHVGLDPRLYLILRRNLELWLCKCPCWTDKETEVD